MFRYGLFSPEGDYLGEFVTDVPDWSVGDTFTTGDRRSFRILATVSSYHLDPTGRSWGYGKSRQPNLAVGAGVSLATPG